MASNDILETLSPKKTTPNLRPEAPNIHQVAVGKHIFTALVASDFWVKVNEKPRHLVDS